MPANAALFSLLVGVIVGMESSYQSTAPNSNLSVD
jgi:hypothetical protein